VKLLTSFHQKGEHSAPLSWIADDKSKIHTEQLESLNLDINEKKSCYIAIFETSTEKK
jgi:hypothetical protein